MFRPILGAGALFGAMLGAALSTPARAADMPFAAEPPAPVNEEMLEWGSNWYLRGDLGIARTSPTDLNGVILSPDMPNNWTIGLGGGYKFNNYLRADFTVDYESLYNKNGPTISFTPCQYAAEPTVNPANGVITGSTPLSDQCYPNTRNRTEAMLVLANAYVDLGTWYGFTPYVGAGVGVNVLYQRAEMNWYRSMTGRPYDGTTWVDPFTNLTNVGYMNSTHQGTFLRFAYAFMGGVSYDFDENWKVDVGYRYANLGKITGVDRNNLPVNRDLISHQVRVGFRYMLN